MGGSENSPVDILSNTVLSAASVYMIPSQFIRSEGRLHGPTSTWVPFTVAVFPHKVDSPKLYFPPKPQQDIRGNLNPAIYA